MPQNTGRLFIAMIITQPCASTFVYGHSLNVESRFVPTSSRPDAVRTKYTGMQKMKFITVNHKNGHIYLICYSMAELFASLRHGINFKRVQEITNSIYLHAVLPFGSLFTHRVPVEAGGIKDQRSKLICQRSQN